MSRILFPHTWLSAILIACLVSAPGATLGQTNLPNLGQGTSILSAEEEQQLGRQFMRHARRTMDFVEDPELTQYITELGNRLAAHSNEPGTHFDFNLVRDDTLNAFAVPGGHIVVNTGLIVATETEGELASVIGHELAHLTQHHLARMLGQSKGVGFKMLGALAAAILLGGEAGQAAVMMTNASVIENRLSYSREFEREADAIGLQTLARAGYDPRAMPKFFEVLQRWARVYNTDVPAFLQDHPLTSERIADAWTRADKYPQHGPRNQPAFYHIRAKIKAVFSDNPTKTAAEFAAKLQSGDYRNRSAMRYGFALALAKSGKYDAALAVLNKIVDNHPNSIRIRTARANILVDAGRYDRALQSFTRIHKQWPDRLVLNLYYSTALIQAGHYSDAKRILKRQLLIDPTDPRLYSLLARAEGETGNALAAHQNLAEYYYLRHNLEQSVKQLKLAQGYVDGSDYARQSVAARLKEVKRELAIHEQE